LHFEWSAITDALRALLRGAAATVLVCRRIARHRHGRWHIAWRAHDVRSKICGVRRAALYRADPRHADGRADHVHLFRAAYPARRALFRPHRGHDRARREFLRLSRRDCSQRPACGSQRAPRLYVIGPVAFRRMVPALGNQYIIGLKDTSLLIVIGVGELTRTGQEIITENYRAAEIWCARSQSSISSSSAAWRSSSVLSRSGSRSLERARNGRADSPDPP
jgi:hypothetical protein